MRKFGVIVNNNKIAEFEEYKKAKCFCQNLIEKYTIKEIELIPRYFESIFILNTNIDLREFEEIQKKIVKIFNDNRFKETKKEYFGIKKLAYTIKEKKEGYYVILNFKGYTENPNKILSKIELKLNKLENILKYIVIKKDENED